MLPEELHREARGREAFAALTRSWMARSGWSFATFADLAEQATIALDAPGIAPLAAGEAYKKGQIRLANGHVWRAIRDGVVEDLPKLRDESDQGTSGDWKRVGTVRRVFASQINNLQRQVMRSATAVIFDSYGLLNQYISEVQAGKREGPASQKLRRHVMEAAVIEDEQGLYGPEEFLSVFLGRLDPPFLQQAMTDQEASKLSASVAKQIRDGITSCGLDIVEDWAQFVSVYPSSDPIRLAKIRDVALGLSNWSADQVSDEEAAVRIALARLIERHGTPSPLTHPLIDEAGGRPVNAGRGQGK